LPLKSRQLSNSGCPCGDWFSRFKTYGEIEYERFKTEFESRHQESSTPTTTNLRTCTVSLKKILGEVSTVADQHYFKQNVDHAAGKRQIVLPS
jgi:hypothetical protein